MQPYRLKKEHHKRAKHFVFSIVLGAVVFFGAASQLHAEGGMPVAVKSWNGKIDLQIPAKTYARAELVALAGDPTNALSKVFGDIDWFRNSALATMDALPQNGKHYSKPLGFNDAGTQLRIAHNITYKNQSQQVMVATWNIADNHLKNLVVLTPQSELIATSRDQRYLAVQVNGALVLFDSQTGQSRHILWEKDNERFPHIPNHAGFSPDGRYFAAPFTQAVRKADGSADTRLSTVNVNVFDVGTGASVATFKKALNTTAIIGGTILTFSPDSTSFLIQWEKCSECKGDKYRYELGNVSSWRTQEAAALNGEYSQLPNFSADSQYLVKYDYLHDVKNNTMVDGYGWCSGGSGKIGPPIDGSDLNLYRDNNKLEYVQVLSGACAIVSESKLPAYLKNFAYADIVFSNDHKMIAVLSQTYDASTKPSLYIIDSQFPNARAVQVAVKQAEDTANREKQYEEADKMFKAGFPEEALEIINDIIEKNGDEPNITRLAISWILYWSRDLPLAEVGKALLRHQALIMAQPKIPTDGFTVGKLTVGKGIGVKKVLPESNAARAGLTVGDTLLDVDGLAITGETQYTKYLNARKPGDTITLNVLRNGSTLTVPLKLDATVDGIVWAAYELAEYGVIAAAAGHPHITQAAAIKMQKFVDTYRSSLDQAIFNNFVVMLESLSIASRGDTAGAYKYAVKNGGFVKEKDTILIFQFNDPYMRHFLAPLFENRKKLAYLLGIKESELRKTPTRKFKAQPYPDLNGNMIAAGKNSAQIKPKIKPKVLLLD